jgi:cell shape-determining protein MreC
LSSIKELSYLAAKIEFQGMMEALMVQLDDNSERMSEKQVESWQKIAHLGLLFVDQCEDNFLEISKLNIQARRYCKELAEQRAKIQELRTEIARVRRMNVELNEALAKGIRV